MTYAFAVPSDRDDALAETLIDLLDGDFVRLETDDSTVTTEVIDHAREPVDGGNDGWRYTIRFMPIGDDATRVTPDRYRVTVEPDGRGGWSVSDLIAEVFVEEDLAYELDPRGELVAIDALGRP